MQIFVQHLKPENITIYELDPRHPQGKPFQIITIFGAGSLALTLVSRRATNDLDILATDAFATFSN
ncbi:hypothetical protein OH491_24985 [Termitidicoccus mucosus]|uniref:hypothetical protein n=1 Tax=Termitidicoccus mucosus TaxID=1184151 RepID=UPI0011AB457F